MICKHCGKEIKDGVKFCPYCGESQLSVGSDDKEEKADVAVEKSQEPEKESVDSEKQPKSSGLSRKGIYTIAAAVVVAVVVVAAVAGTTVHRRNADSAEDFQIAAEDYGNEGSEELILQVEDVNSDTEEVEAVMAETEEGIVETQEAESSESQELDSGRSGNGASGSSKEYKNAYDYTSENVLTILEYYVTYGNTFGGPFTGYGYLLFDDEDPDLGNNQYFENALSVLYGEEHEFEAAIDAYDPSIFSVLASVKEEINIESMDYTYVASQDYELYTGNVGTNVYFAGIDVVDQFMSLDKDVYLMMTGFTRTVRKDACDVIGVYGDYALVCSTGSIIEILNQMCAFSGYTVAVKNVNRIIDLLEAQYNTTEENGGNETLNGRIDALNDYIDKWNEARKQWETEFISDYGMTWESFVNPNVLEGQDMTAEEYIDSVRDDIFGTSNSDGDFSRYTAYSTKDLLNLYIYQLVDKDSNVLCSHVEYLANSAKVGYDGKWTLVYNDDCELIMDKEGNILLNTDKTKYVPGNQMTTSEYTGMTPSGNYLICSEESTYEQGNYKILEWLSSDGSTKEIMQAQNFTLQPVSEDSVEDYYSLSGEYSLIQPEWDYSDIWKITPNATSGGTSFIDMETGEIIEYQKEESVDVPNGYVQISPDYYMDQNSYYVYDSADLTNPIAELTDGEGVGNLLYDIENDVYWVISRSGYYYKLDRDFTYLSEPVKIPDEAIDWELTPYGVLVSEEESSWNYLYLLDENGNEISRHLRAYENGTFTIGFFEICNRYSNISEYNCNYCYNLNNSELLCITKPDSSKDDNATTKDDKTEEDVATAEQDEAMVNEEEEDAEEDSQQYAGTSNRSSEESMEATGGSSQVEATEIPLDTKIYVSSNEGEWFSFTIDEPAKIKFSAVHIASYHTDYFYLYDADGEKLMELKPTTGGSAETGTTSKEMNSGTYYIYHAPYVGGVNVDSMFWVEIVE